MAGPLAGISAAEIAKQKLPDQAQQANKASPSKFDQHLAAKGSDPVNQGQAVAQVQHAQKVEQLRHVEATRASEQTRFNKVSAQQTSSDQPHTHTDPVTQKAEVSKA